MKKLAILLAIAPLAGCIKFTAPPPSSLLTLTAGVSVPVGETRSGATAASITVLTPQVPQELATTRVPVQATPTQIAYVREAQWVEQPSRLFARLLADTLTARTGRLVLSQRQSLADSGTVLSGELCSFGVLAATREAVVVYDATLMRAATTGPANVYERRRFEARVPVSAIEPRPVGLALNEAANRVAEDVAAWVGN